jgi:dTDP-4-dehydrorhamnose 3,5-epimerase
VPLGAGVIFTETEIKGLFVIEPERHSDHRGFFARTFCASEFQARKLDPTVAQCSVSYNVKKGTLRGMHYQVSPNEEVKVVRCTQGAIFDVAIDLRRDSETYGRHFAIVLSAENRKMLYIPTGFAHGFQTLTNNSEVFYQMSTAYAPESARGIRWDDPRFAIEWPPGERTIIERDRNYPDFQD